MTTLRVQELREEAGLSKAKLARLAGVNEKTIRKIESGDHRPSLTTVAKLSIALGVPITALLDEPART